MTKQFFLIIIKKVFKIKNIGGEKWLGRVYIAVARFRQLGQQFVLIAKKIPIKKKKKNYLLNQIKESMKTKQKIKKKDIKSILALAFWQGLFFSLFF